MVLLHGRSLQLPAADQHTGGKRCATLAGKGREVAKPLWGLLWVLVRDFSRAVGRGRTSRLHPSTKFSRARHRSDSPRPHRFLAVRTIADLAIDLARIRA